MAKTTNPRKPTKKIYRTSKNHHPDNQPSYHLRKAEKTPPPPPPPSWAVMKSILTCKHLQVENQKLPQKPQQKQKQQQKQGQHSGDKSKKSKTMKCSGSLCNNTKVMQRPESSASSPEILHKKKASSNSSSNSMKSVPSKEINNNTDGVVGNGSSAASSSSLMSVSCTSNAASSISNGGGTFKGMPFRRLSGCYECRMVVDPVLRATICSCSQCGEIFMKAEHLELHQAVRHAVSELGPEDTSKNIVEIIFQSSWLKKQTPVCKIDRILKVHNTQKTVSKFEEYRDSIKAKATKLPKKHPRCIADGNELLRFHCTTFMCSLGLNGSSNLCNSIPQCNVCSIIKNGFKFPGVGSITACTGGSSPSVANWVAGKGVLTTATSGKAHDRAEIGSAESQEKRAMLVCRVIAGRVKKSLAEGSFEEYDSVAGGGGVYSNLDELYVFNPKAILPCFVVVYRGF